MIGLQEESNQIFSSLKVGFGQNFYHFEYTIGYVFTIENVRFIISQAAFKSLMPLPLNKEK